MSLWKPSCLVSLIAAGVIALSTTVPAQALEGAGAQVSGRFSAADGPFVRAEGVLTDKELVPLNTGEGGPRADGFSGEYSSQQPPAQALRIVPCKITQDRPHISQTAGSGYTVNTHLRGKCPAGIVSNSVTGSTYRSAWFGWVHQKSGTGSGSNLHKKLNLAFGCHKNKTYDYRTQGRYFSSFSNGYKGLSYRTTVATNLKCTYR